LQIYLYFSVAEFYNGNLNIPVLNWTPCKADADQQTSFKDVFNLLHLDPPDKCKIAVEKPVCVKKNCRIIVETTNLGYPDDILADDCGVWITNGSPKVYFQQSDDGDEGHFERVGRGKKVAKDTLNEPWFVVQRCYYSNKDALDFKKVVSTVKGENIYSRSCGIFFLLV
jgi:hypothetical protein